MIDLSPTPGERYFPAVGALASPAEQAPGERLAAPLAARLARVVGLVVVARLFGVEAFGLYMIGWTILRCVALVSSLAWQRQAFRFEHPGVVRADLAFGVSQLVLVVAFHSLGWGLPGAVAATGVSLLLGLSLALRTIRQPAPRMESDRGFRVEPPGGLPRFASVASMAGAATLTLIWMDRLMIALHGPTADVGAYQAGTMMALFSTVVLGSFASILAPMIGDLHRTGDSQRLAELFNLLTKWALYISVPLVLLVVFAGRELVTLVFGEEFRAAAALLPILALVQLAGVSAWIVGMMLIMTGRHRTWFRLSAATLGIGLLLNLLLIPRFGLEGAAAATAVSLGFLLVAGQVMVRRRLGCWPYDKCYLKGVFALIPVLLVLLSWSRVDAVGELPSLVVTAAVAGLGFIGLLVAFGLEDADRKLARILNGSTESGGRDERRV